MLITAGRPRNSKKLLSESSDRLRPCSLLLACSEETPLPQEEQVLSPVDSTSTQPSRRQKEKGWRWLEVIPPLECFSSASRSKKTTFWSIPWCPSTHPKLPGRESAPVAQDTTPWVLPQCMWWGARGGGGGHRKLHRSWSCKKHGSPASPRFWHVLCVTGDSQSMGPWRSTNSMAVNPVGKKGQPCTSLHCVPRGLVQSLQGLCPPGAQLLFAAPNPKEL